MPGEPCLLIYFHYEIRENGNLRILIPGYAKMKHIYNNNILNRKTLTFVETLIISLTILGIMFFHHIQIK